MNEKNKDSKFLEAIYRNAEEQKKQIRQDIEDYKKKSMNDSSEKNSALPEISKESKFLDAINRDAAEHMAQITQEIENYKSEKIEQATEQGLQDAYDLIREDLTKRTSKIVNSVAKQELELRNSLFDERQSIRDEVFAQATEKLTSFTQTEDYTAFLERSINEIAEIVGADDCTVYLAPKDEDKSALISSVLTQAQIVLDNHILIGGIRVHCPSKGITLDDTLDLRLSDQYAWFNENSGLKVV